MTPPGGTLKYEPSRSGAFASASSTGSDGRGSSAPHTLTTSSGCEVGGTSERSSSETFDTAVDDVVQLRAEALELVVAQLEPREVGDVEQLFAVDCHSENAVLQKKKRPLPGPLHIWVRQVL